jgi:RNA methyltransferase, TrmH family
MITSIQNPRIQFIRTLIRDPKERKSSGLCIIEGVRLVETALQTGMQPEVLLFAQNISPRGLQLVEQCQAQSIEVLETAPDLLSRVSDTEQPQGILGVFPIPAIQVPEHPDFIVILDCIRDPGNLGTILRTAAAAAVQAVWLAPGCADAFSPKVLRSGMGAHFHLPIQQKTWAEIAGSVDKTGLTLYLADSGGGLPHWQTNLKKPTGLVICNEAEGPSEDARKTAINLIHIPMPGNFESLNASTAASILIFEVVRQRTTA